MKRKGKYKQLENTLNKAILISDITDRSNDFQVKYNSKLVNDNDFIEIKLTAKKPVVNFGKLDPNKYYSLVMVDPDVPPKFGSGYYIHWAKVNIKGSNKRGDTICKYQAPNPPAWDGEHRYFFILYEQSDKVINNIKCERLYKKYNDFVEKLGVFILGKKLKYYITKN